MTEKYPLIYHVRTWAKFALSPNEQDSVKFQEMLTYLSKNELGELLSFLAGYFGTSKHELETLTRGEK